MSDVKTQEPKLTWLRKTPGLPLFGALPPQIVMDSRVSPSNLRIFAALVMHADARGIAYVSQVRLAEILGFKSSRHLISALGSARSDAKKSQDGVLVRLGYVKNLGQTGFNMANTYQLCVPDIGLTAPQSRRQPTAQYKSAKADELRQHEREFIASEFYTDPDTGESISEAQVKQDVSEFNRSGACLLPRAAYVFHGIDYPDDFDEPDSGDFLSED